MKTWSLNESLLKVAFYRWTLPSHNILIFWPQYLKETITKNK